MQFQFNSDNQTKGDADVAVASPPHGAAVRRPGEDTT